MTLGAHRRKAAGLCAVATCWRNAAAVTRSSSEPSWRALVAITMLARVIPARYFFYMSSVAAMRCAHTQFLLRINHRRWHMHELA